MKTIVLLICLITGISGYSQKEFTVSGTISNEQHKKISMGQAYLLNQEGQLIDFGILENGNFTIRAESGKYQLKIEVLNYEVHQTPIDLNKNINLDIKLTDLPQQLDQVEIVSKRKTVSYKNGNININVENSILETLPQTKDLLTRLPKIQVSPDGENLSIIGKGTPLIYLGNQQIQFEELNSIPVTNIKNIEIINNPGAQFEAEGSSAIVVHLKDNLEEGVHVNIAETASFKRRFNNYASTAVNYRKNNIGVTANFEYNQLHHWESNQSEFTLLNEDIYSKYLVVTSAPRPQIISGLLLSYNFDKDTELSTSINYRTHYEDFPIETETLFRKDFQNVDITTLTQNKTKKSYLSSQLNFNKSLSKEQNLFLGAQYSWYGQDLKTEIYNSINQQGYEFLDFRDQDFGIRRGSMRVDYENKFSTLIDFSLGANLSLAGANAYTFIDSQTKNYRYEESIYATYADFSGSLKRFEYQMGLRMEKSLVKGAYASEENLLINRDNINWLPSLQINYSTKNDSQLSLNYKRSVQRPNYSNASSITAYLNPFLEFSGNINLKPTYTDEISLSYHWDKFTLGFSYYTQKDPVYYTAYFNENMERLIMAPNNLERENGMYLELTAPFTYKFLTSYNTALLAYTKIQDAEGIQSFNAKPFLYYYSNNEFNILPKTKFAINFWGQTTRFEGIYKRNAMVVVGASISRTFFEKWQLSLNLNDLFKQLNYRERYQINNIRTDSIFFADGQEIAIGIKYSFGKELKDLIQQEMVDEELDRVN
ncbi:outer membrane beta-barrel family protein [Salegentibacter sp. LM13S]|uniref:outer membrane beta-barrel family protein n=1 Tax=Salegentibacter lacus TaxID=2873599 RepID=UPI001CCBAC8D|nr:outer membrane beta-barrel family protein [Salegentibacter lacus]MBZ9629789.1 outer membrane beta-barrel family protein [Salegentibacter lacus]